MSTHALASLTATYTDSEPEGEEEDPVIRDDKSRSSEDEDDESSRAPSIENLKFVEPPRPQATLVSYHDDIADDDDDEGLDQRTTDTPPTYDDGIELPPEPSGRVSPRLLEKISKLYEKTESGLDLNAIIQNKKEFRNPSIYEKLIQYLGINELGTNYPPRMYDPLKWGKESFYDELAKVQKAEMERREKEKKEKAKVEFVVGTKKPAGEDDQRKRKSKWDQVGSGGGTAGLLRSSGLLQPSLTTAASGTKSTIISAFGSLPKKPKI